MADDDDKRECIACVKTLSPDAQGIMCSACAHWYHLGKCAGVTKTKFKEFIGEQIKAWQCATCKMHFTRQASADKDSNESSQSNKNGDQPQLAKLMTQLTSMSTILTEVLNRMDAMEKSIAVQSVKHDAVIAKLTQQEKTVEGIEANRQKMHKMESVILKQDLKIRELKATVDSVEQYSRRNNVEIHGVRQNEKKNLLNVIQWLATKLELPVPTADDIEAVHRLGPREGKTPPIILRFKDRAVRDLWITKRVVLRQERIFINENLNKSLRQLFWSAKQCAKEKHYKYVWCTNGKIFVRHSEQKPAIRINNEEDLLKIL
ncbi:unnamed protein product [Ixodes persulcatus]